MTETATVPVVRFRSIGDLAMRCGHYCWLEHQLFGLTGRWASTPVAGTSGVGGPSDYGPEVRVLCSQMSSWHGFVARQWRDRLPVRTGVDPDALVVPPPGGVNEAIEFLGSEPNVMVAVDGLVDLLLPALLAAYDDDAASGSPVSEGPVLALLELVRHQTSREIEAGGNLLDRVVESDAATEKGADLRVRLQRVLEGNPGIFPAARPS